MHLCFGFKMPLPREGMELDYSRWQQYLMGLLQVEVSDDNSNVLANSKSIITIDTRLAYRNKNDKKWKHLAHSMEQRELDCTTDNLTQVHSCHAIHLFELGSLHHDYYLLNIRLPVDSQLKLNLNIGHIKDLQLTLIYQNGGFTKVWLGLKSFFCPFLSAIMFWFKNRLKQLKRTPVVIESTLICLGTALTVLNCEYIFIRYKHLFIYKKNKVIDNKL